MKTSRFAESESLLYFSVVKDNNTTELFAVPAFKSCFSIDIDLIPKIFKILLGGSSSCFGARIFSKTVNISDFPNVKTYKK